MNKPIEIEMFLMYVNDYKYKIMVFREGSINLFSDLLLSRQNQLNQKQLLFFENH
jgi:hypothetical protein